MLYSKLGSKGDAGAPNISDATIVLEECDFVAVA